MPMHAVAGLTRRHRPPRRPCPRPRMLEPLGVVHAQSEDAAKRAVSEVQRAYAIGAAVDEPPPVIHALLV